MPMNKRILVTGTHRSGTTWMGKILSANSDVSYIHEPFNVDIGRAQFGLPIDRWFAYYPDLQDKPTFDAAYPRVLTFSKPGSAADTKYQAIAPVDRLKRLVKRYRNDVLIKDPLALMSAEHLAKAYDMQVVCMIRRPLAFCSSIKKWNWAFPFEDFLAQPTLMADHFEAYRSQIETFADKEQNIIDQGILLWNLFHSVIQTYQQRHPDWVFLKHEDVTLAPMPHFETTYRRLGLPFTEKAKQAVKASSQSSAGETKDHEFKARDKQAVLTTWQDRLTQEEVERINEQTRELSAVFYPDDDAA